MIGPRGPDSLDLTDHEVDQLLTVAAVRLAAVGVALHWPKARSDLLTAKVVLNGGRTPPSDLGAFLGSKADYDSSAGEGSDSTRALASPGSCP